MKKLLFSLFLFTLFLFSAPPTYALGNVCTLNIYPAPSVGTNNYNIRWTNDTGELTKFLVLRDNTGIEFNQPASPITPSWYDNPVYPDSISISSSTGVSNSSYIDFVANITYTDANASPITSSSNIVSGYNGDHWGCDGIATITNINYAPSVKVISSPSSGSKVIGSPFNITVQVTDDNEDPFNAARSTVTVSSNLSITGINAPTSNACNLNYTQTPTTTNPSFAGALFGTSSTGCNVYTMTLTPMATGTGTITFTNSSVKSYVDNSEIFTGVENASFTLTDGPTPTPTPLLEFAITNPLYTYDSSFDLFGTKLSTITKIFVNGSDSNSTYPTSTTWENAVILSLGANNFTLYGSDASNNQTATQTTTVYRHTLGDINGDGNIDLVDASLFAVDWDKTSNLTYILSDMNDDGVVNLTDLSILAKLIE